MEEEEDETQVKNSEAPVQTNKMPLVSIEEEEEDTEAKPLINKKVPVVAT